MNVEAEIAVLKEQIKQMSESFEGHVNQNREDFKEVHSRMSTMKREISEEINLTFEEIRIFLLVNISSGFILTFVRITTNGTTEVPEIRSYFLESFKPRCA